MSLAAAYGEAIQAQTNARWLYAQLAAAIAAGKYELNRSYGGLQIKSIWEAKPVAWRPVPHYQYDLGLQEGPLQVDWQLSGDLLHDYHKAHGIEREAWSKFQALYIEAVYAGLREGKVLATSDHSNLKIYEVKPA